MSYPVFIPNNPNGEDYFPEKAQEKLANAMADLISKKESKSKIIGLEGDWGSGKTNVVKMIENKLSGTHHTYIHDLWIYQEDLQRRTFLDCLTESLIIEGNASILTNPEKWGKKLKELHTTKKETRSIIDTRLSQSFALIIIAIFLWNFLGEIGGPMTIEWGAKFHYRILILPYILLVIYYLWRKGELKPNKLLQVINNNQDDGVKTIFEETYDYEPSISNFSKWIIDLQSDFQDEKELLIVFDNLDRIPDEKLKEFWSLIHTFYSDEHFDKIWVLVPYSRTQIASAFNNKEEHNHFIDKTFTIKFQVPPPILKDWKDFFNKKFKDAFGNTEDSEKILVQNVADRLIPQITPRKLINFINDLVALKKLWKDEIPLRYIALFSLQKNLILNKDPTYNIISKSFLKTCETLFKGDNEILSYISALTYNINTDSASQIVIKEYLKSRLRSEHHDSMDDFAGKAYFIEILETALMDQGDDTIDFETIIDSISEDNIKRLDQERLNHIWQILSKNYLARSKERNDFTINDKIFLKRMREDKKQEYVVQLINMLNVPDGKLSGSKYFSFAKQMEELCKSEELNIELNFPTLEKDPEIFIEYLKEASGEYLKYKLTTDSKLLNTNLISKPLNELEGLDVLIYLKQNEKYNLSDFIDHLKTKIEIGSEVELGNFKSVFKVFKALSDERPLKNILPFEKTEKLISQITDDPYTLTNLFSIKLCYLINNPIGVIDTPFAIDNIEFKEELQNCIEDYLTLGELIKFSIKNEGTNLISIVQSLILEGEKLHKLEIKEVLMDFQNIHDRLNIPIEYLIKFLNKWSSDAINQIDSSNVKGLINTPHIFDILLNHPCDLIKHLEKSMIDYIENISESDWVHHLKENACYEFEVLYILLKRNILAELSPGILNAYNSVLEYISNGSYPVPSSLEKWNKLYEVSNKSQMISTLIMVLDNLIEDFDIERFKFFELMLRENKILNKKPKVVTQNILLQAIDYEDILKNIVLRNAEFYVKIINKSGADSESFKQKIKSKSENDLDNIELKELAINIGVTI